MMYARVSKISVAHQLNLGILQHLIMIVYHKFLELQHHLKCLKQKSTNCSRKLTRFDTTCFRYAQIISFGREGDLLTWTAEEQKEKEAPPQEWNNQPQSNLHIGLHGTCDIQEQATNTRMLLTTLICRFWNTRNHPRCQTNGSSYSICILTCCPAV